MANTEKERYPMLALTASGIPDLATGIYITWKAFRMQGNKPRKQPDFRPEIALSRVFTFGNIIYFSPESRKRAGFLGLENKVGRVVFYCVFGGSGRTCGPKGSRAMGAVGGSATAGELCSCSIYCSTRRFGRHLTPVRNPPPPMGFEICSALDVRVDVDDGDRVNVVEDSQKSKPEQ